MSQNAEVDQGSVVKDAGTRATRLGPRMVPLDDLNLDAIMARFRVSMCVIDGLPETHETLGFI